MGDFYSCCRCVVKEPLMCFNQPRSARGLPEDCVSVMDREGESDKARAALRGV